MRKVTKFLVLLTCLLSWVCAKEAASKQEKALVSDYSEINLPTISVREKIESVFAVRSVGTDPVTVLSFDIIGDDSDLEISTPIAPIILKPHQTTNIGLIFDPHVAGKATADIQIKTDSKTTPLITIHVTANSYDPTLDRAKLNKINILENCCTVFGFGL